VTIAASIASRTLRMVCGRQARCGLRRSPRILTFPLARRYVRHCSRAAVVPCSPSSSRAPQHLESRGRKLAPRTCGTMPAPHLSPALDLGIVLHGV
jgi:hypothetical protein